MSTAEKVCYYQMRSNYVMGVSFRKYSTVVDLLIIIFQSYHHVSENAYTNNGRSHLEGHVK